MKEIHPRAQFENEIERKFGDILKFLKKEYKNINKTSVSLTEDTDADILVQSTSRYHTWVQATKQYNINTDSADTVSLRRTSDRSIDKPFEKRFQDFLELSSDKRPSNDTAKKNPETPEG